MIKLMDSRSIPFVCEEIWRYIHDVLENFFASYMHMVNQCISSNTRSPDPSFGAEAAFDFLNTELISLLNLQDLQSEILQVFREVGNAIFFVRQLEHTLVRFNFRAHELV